MYAHVVRKAELIGLLQKEILITRQTVWIQRGEVVIAIGVILAA